MNYFEYAVNRMVYEPIFKSAPYAIPLNEILMIKRCNTERVYYALYYEDKQVFLLTGVNIENDQLIGNGAYAKPYCLLTELDKKNISQLDCDAYNCYMTIAR